MLLRNLPTQWECPTDEDASNFLDVMESFKTSDGDELTNFMCQTAETVASLSEWVLSELKVRNLIL